MTGHKKEIRPGVWRLRVSAGKDPATGKYLYKSKTVEGGPRIADRALAELVAASKDSRSSVTLGQLLTEFLQFRERQGIGIRTLASYRMLAKNHIYPRLGSYKLEKLIARELDREYDKMADNGVGVSTIEHVHRLVRAALSQAEKWGYVDHNVAKMASPPHSPRSVVTAPTPEELGQILTATFQRSPQVAAVFALCALTGARRGEVLALRWSDFDTSQKVLTISKSVGYTSTSGIFVKATKTMGVRKIGVGKLLEDVIQSQVQELKKHVDLGFDLVTDPYIFFGSPDGSAPLHPDTPSKLFRSVCDSLTLSYHLHQLRHFVGTELTAASFDPVTVAGRLGHDPAVLLGTYAHAVQARDRAASEYLETLIKLPHQSN